MIVVVKVSVSGEISKVSFKGESELLKIRHHIPNNCQGEKPKIKEGLVLGNPVIYLCY